jgi:hypothetical protein
MTLSAPNTITNHQDACVQKAIDTVNDLPNALLTCPPAPRMGSYDAKLFERSPFSASSRE